MQKGQFGNWCLITRATKKLLGVFCFVFCVAWETKYASLLYVFKAKTVIHVGFSVSTNYKHRQGNIYLQLGLNVLIHRESKALYKLYIYRFSFSIFLMRVQMMYCRSGRNGWQTVLLIVSHKCGEKSCETVLLTGNLGVTETPFLNSNTLDI